MKSRTRQRSRMAGGLDGGESGNATKQVRPAVHRRIKRINDDDTLFIFSRSFLRLLFAGPRCRAHGRAHVVVTARLAASGAENAIRRFAWKPFRTSYAPSRRARHFADAAVGRVRRHAEDATGPDEMRSDELGSRHSSPSCRADAELGSSPIRRRADQIRRLLSK